MMKVMGWKWDDRPLSCPILTRTGIRVSRECSMHMKYEIKKHNSSLLSCKTGFKTTISRPGSLGSFCVKGTDESLTTVDLLVP